MIRWIEDQILSFITKRCKHPGEMVAADILQGAGRGFHAEYCRRCGAVKLDWHCGVDPIWRLPDPNLWRGL